MNKCISRASNPHSKMISTKIRRFIISGEFLTDMRIPPSIIFNTRKNKQRDPNPKDNPLTRKETYTYEGFHSTSATLFSYQRASVRVRVPLFAICIYLYIYIYIYVHTILVFSLSLSLSVFSLSLCIRIFMHI